MQLWRRGTFRSNEGGTRQLSTTTTYCILSLLATMALVAADTAMQIVRNPEPIVVPLKDKVSFDCKVNLKPDRFEWRRLPKWPESMSGAVGLTVEKHAGKKPEAISELVFTVENETSIGGYQCIAWYGSQALASVPASLSIAELAEFPKQEHVTYSVSPGNTVTIQCPAPMSNPPAQLAYFKNSKMLPLNDEKNPNGLLELYNVTYKDSGDYSCTASNYFIGSEVVGDFKITLRVINKNKEAPKFLRIPPDLYTAQERDNITLECSAVGTPVPTVHWKRRDGSSLPLDRMQSTKTGLRLFNVTKADQGGYECEITNGLMPSLTHHVTLMIHEPPVIVNGPADTNTTEGENLELECTIKGVPEPTVHWIINSHSVLTDTHIEAIGNKIYINPVEKRHAGIVQCFATNVAGTVFKSSMLTVYPKQRSGNDVANEERHKHHRKHRKNKRRKDKDKLMIPPSKPNITRLSDSSVMVRWNVPENDGMPITFFKIQYREVKSNDPERRIKSSKWMTLGSEISPAVTTYEVNPLYPDSVYKFRIAAVYSNDDNKFSPNSEKFHLQKQPFFGKNPLPTPVLMHTEALNFSAIKIYWELSNPNNVSIEGFYVYYRIVSSAAEYIKETVDNPDTRMCVITNFLPEQRYEFKLQSFNASAASDFSAILSQLTLARVTETTVVSVVNTSSGVGSETIVGPQLYIIIGAAVGGIALLTGAVFLLIICKRYRKKKSQADIPQNEASGSNKRNSNESAHHIQAESKEYNAKNSLPGSVGRRMHNGCPAPGPKLTITPNPLAQSVEEDKNQNVMEMSSLCPSKNNNRSSAISSASSSSQSAQEDVPKQKGKCPKEKQIKGRKTGENYV